MSLFAVIVPNAILYMNNSTATQHKVSALSNGQFLVDGYFVIDKYRLDTDFQIVPIVVAGIGLSDADLHLHSQELKEHIGNFQHADLMQGQPYKSACLEPHTHTPEEDKVAEDNKDEQARNIHNVTTEFTTATINTLPVKEKPVHIRVTDTNLIPDGYYATDLIIGGVDQGSIYCYYK